MIDRDLGSNGGRGCLHAYPDGERCRAFSVKGKDRCIAHADQNTRDCAARKMRAAHKQRLNPESVSDLLVDSSWNLKTMATLMKIVIRDVHEGRTAPNVAHAITALGNVAIRALEGSKSENPDASLSAMNSEKLSRAFAVLSDDELNALEEISSKLSAQR